MPDAEIVKPLSETVKPVGICVVTAMAIVATFALGLIVGFTGVKLVPVESTANELKMYCGESAPKQAGILMLNAKAISEKFSTINNIFITFFNLLITPVSVFQYSNFKYI